MRPLQKASPRVAFSSARPQWSSSSARAARLHTSTTTRRATAFPVEVLDTVGAGDGFAAGFISARLDGENDEEALRRACAVGALATTSEGDMDGLPTRKTLEEALRAHA